MDFKEIQQLFNNPKNIKQQILDGEVFTDEAIINICDEYNKDKSRFSPKRVNTKQIVKGYHKLVERMEKVIEKENELQKTDAEKELEALLKATGLTLEEFNSLTPMERAQLKMQFEQNKHVKNITAMEAMNSISNGMRKL